MSVSRRDQSKTYRICLRELAVGYFPNPAVISYLVLLPPSLFAALGRSASIRDLGYNGELRVRYPWVAQLTDEAVGETG